MLPFCLGLLFFIRANKQYNPAWVVDSGTGVNQLQFPVLLLDVYERNTLELKVFATSYLNFMEQPNKTSPNGKTRTNKTHQIHFNTSHWEYHEHQNQGDRMDNTCVNGFQQGCCWKRLLQCITHGIQLTKAVVCNTCN